MRALGEESGKWEQMLSKVSASYEHEIDRTLKIITSLLEPLLILVMGSIVGVIVIAMLLPIFQINVLMR
jgi:type II secretory pathway component PulF